HVHAFHIGERHRIGTRRPRAAKEIGMKDLQRERFPSAGRSAREPARPRLLYCAIALLDLRNQLVHDRVAIRTDVYAVHGIRIVEVRRRMLKRDREHARKVVGAPLIAERRPLRSPASPASSASVESVRRAQTEMSLDVVDRIADRRRRVIPRKKNGCAEIYWPAPELREQRALDAKTLDEFVVSRERNRRKHFVRDKLDDCFYFRIESNFLWRAVDVSGRSNPVLP